MYYSKKDIAIKPPHFEHIYPSLVANFFMWAAVEVLFLSIFTKYDQK